jgi:lipid II:glycine glycyltransferase (peptidoglycan interpeptide bridge formation enzyme)
MSSISAHQVRDAAGWDELLLRLPAPHPLQSNLWAEHKQRYGWRPSRWVFEQDGRLRGAALILRRRAAPLPFSVLYVPKGPILDDWGDAGLVQAVLAHLEREARRQAGIFIKIDPDVDYPPAPDLCQPYGAEAAEALRRRGWLFSRDQIQYRNTVLLDLRPDEDALLEAMKPKTRYNIRLAERKGVQVSAGGVQDLPAFYQLYLETSQRDGFLIRDFAYYRSVWERFLEAGRGALLLARAEGQLLAGLFLFLFGPRAWYMYGASSGHMRHLMPNYLLQWEAMREARRRGCTAYDLWGAPDELNEDDPMWGVYRFKAGFGGVLVRHIGAYDFPVSRALYSLYTVLIPRYLALLRRRHGAAPAGPPAMA